MSGSTDNIPAEKIVREIMNGSRSALSRAITLIESFRPDHQDTAHRILDNCLQHRHDTLRIGITGSPGTGKSTFIEAIGLEILDNPANKLAILTIDPSSKRSGGSILGDKARMEKLSGRKDVFIRPSPSSGHLGGTSPKTHEAILLCEAAGYNIIIVETVGVGQSETSIESMVDYILLLILPGSGDELQGIKRGIMEIADGIAITKTDEASKKSAFHSKASCESALKLLPKKHPAWDPQVIHTSSISGEGIKEVLDNILQFAAFLRGSNLFEENRKKQLNQLFRSQVNLQLQQAFYNHPEISSSFAAIAAKVEERNFSPLSGAKKLVEKVIRSPR